MSSPVPGVTSLVPAWWLGSCLVPVPQSDGDDAGHNNAAEHPPPDVRLAVPGHPPSAEQNSSEDRKLADDGRSVEPTEAVGPSVVKVGVPSDSWLYLVGHSDILPARRGAQTRRRRLIENGTSSAIKAVGATGQLPAGPSSRTERAVRLEHNRRVDQAAAITTGAVDQMDSAGDLRPPEPSA
jgi:hypothetical protein